MLNLGYMMSILVWTV